MSLCQLAWLPRPQGDHCEHHQTSLILVLFYHFLPLAILTYGGVVQNTQRLVKALALRESTTVGIQYSIC